MDIECKLKRDGGSKIQLDNITYHFLPRADGAQVSEVKEDDHIDRLLSIPEAYRLYRGNADPVVSEIASTDGEKLTVKYDDAGKVSGFEIKHEPAEDPIALLGSTQHPQIITVGGANYTQAEIVAKAADGIDPEAWNALTDEDRADKIDTVLDTMDDAAPDVPPVPATTMALRDQYQAKFGKKAHHKWSDETIAAKLTEATA